MTSLDMPVTLIVKAPNQQIEDQTIQCELSWTIKRLKGYLSEVYPSRPHTDEQKLIYSGHLLHDTCTLREVLRTYEGHQQHTVHLVCARNSISSLPPKKTESADSEVSDGLRRRAAPSSSASSSSDSRSGGVSPNTPASSASPSSVNQTAQPVVDAPQPQPSDLNQMWGSFYSGLHPPPFPQAAQMPPHMAHPQMAQWTQAQYAAWMQQAYAQYMAQYMHVMMAQAGGSPFQWPLAASVTSTEPTLPNHAHDLPAPGQGQGGNAERGAAEEGEDEENPAQRDWLDWFYFMSRIGVFFSVVYFYSSPMRFIVVFALGLLMYLYQVGFFRPLDDLVADNNNDPARADAAAAAINDNNNNNQAAAAVGAGAAAVAEADDGEGRAADAANNAAIEADPTIAADRPSLLALTWTFFTSFFASLIPEQPNVI